MSRGAKHVELCVFRGQALQVSKLRVLVWIWIVVSCKDTMIAALLGKNDVDEIDQAHVKITAALNLVVTQAKAVKGAVNDLLAAKRSREKEVERQQQAAKRKAEQAAVKEERKRQRQNEEETARRRITDQTQSHRIDKLPGHLFCKASLYADVLALTTNAPDGMHPCLVSAPPVPCMTGGVFTEHVGAFKAQFPTTSAAKSTGRAQCSFRPAALKAEVETFMRKLSPWVTPDLSNFDEVAAELSLFGCVQGMSFVSSEWNGMGQVRYLLEGSRKVFAAPCGWLVQAVRKVGKDVQTEEQLYTWFRHLSEQHITALNGVANTPQIVSLVQDQGQLVGDFTEQVSIGLRYAALSSQDVVSGNLEQLINLISDGKKQKGTMQKLLQAAKNQLAKEKSEKAPAKAAKAAKSAKSPEVPEVPEAAEPNEPKPAPAKPAPAKSKVKSQSGAAAGK